MSCAFLIIAHADVELLRRLVRQLKGHDVFVHWDRKSGPPPLVEGATMIAERVSVFWAGYTQIEATAALLRAALASGKSYTKIMLLSGACYPIKPVDELVAMFEADGGHNYINAVKVDESPHLRELVRPPVFRDALFPDWARRTKLGDLLERVVRRALNTFLKLFSKSRPPGLELFHGSQWWALSGEAAAFALNRIDTDPAIAKFYRRTFASDEQVFQTIIRNSEFASLCAPTLPFTGRGTYQTANLHIIDPSLSKWFDVSDIDLVGKSDAFFVRKVSSSRSGPLLDWLDEHRLAKAAAKDS